MNQLLSLLILIPLVGGVITYLVGRFNKEATKYSALSISIITGILFLLTLTKFNIKIGKYQLVEEYSWLNSIGSQILLGIDGLSATLVGLTILLTIVAIGMSWKKIKKKKKSYYPLLLLLEAGLIGVFLSLDFIIFFIFWEITLIPMFFIIAIWGGERRLYASIKFFIYTHLSSLFLLISIIAIYLHSPIQTFSIPVLTEITQTFSPQLQLMIFIGVFIGFAVKMPIVPFHTWLPDAHVEAPTPGSVMLAGVLLKMGGYVLIRVGYMMLPSAIDLAMPILAIISIVTMFYAGFVAMGQEDLKSLIAYSSVGHMGIVLFGVASMTVYGIAGGIYQMISHGLISALLFSICGMIKKDVGTRKISKLSGLAKETPTLTGILVFGSFAGLGLPSLSGFIAELTVFIGAFSTWEIYTILAIISLIVTASYFIWMLQRTIFGESQLNSKEINWKIEITSLIPLIILIIIFGVYPDLLFDYINPFVKLITSI
ncbi:MAG: NADH dehydrogenase subunit M [Candidatus Methanohalarchaeum thermophilum]|uniref:NADH dehydrogenase subunit M n=1 Tax=Methanohalarchaeum thermophilum TaxID=1903181 RepID=A0A1Q6DX67_METT1|nr:MAG: NADH dehydrogenase subunit M [Candidatus Methanohalarchaeum thermophilum]